MYCYSTDVGRKHVEHYRMNLPYVLLYVPAPGMTQQLYHIRLCALEEERNSKDTAFTCCYMC